MSRQNESGRDAIDIRQSQWARELPDVSTTGMAVLGRARWLTIRARPAIEAVFTRHGLDSGEFDVLATLLREGPPYRLRPTELFRSLMISSGGLTDRLKRLAEAGLIERPAADGDARSLPVQLTRKGRTCAECAFREDMAVERDLLAALSEKEVESLSVLLRKLSLGFDQRD